MPFSRLVSARLHRLHKPSIELQFVSSIVADTAEVRFRGK